MLTLKEIKKQKGPDADRLTEAEKDFRRLQREIQPFLRPRKIRRESSTGRWIDTSSLELLDR